MDWFVFGGFVLDRIFQVSRAERVSVYFGGERPHPARIYEAIGTESHFPIDFTDTRPPIICSFDRFVILQSQEVCDIVKQEVVQPALPIEATLLTFELTAGDLLRLVRISRVYPEIRFDSLLADRLTADLRHLASIRGQFEQLQLEFLANDLD